MEPGYVQFVDDSGRVRLAGFLRGDGAPLPLGRYDVELQSSDPFVTHRAEGLFEAAGPGWFPVGGSLALIAAASPVVRIGVAQIYSVPAIGGAVDLSFTLAVSNADATESLIVTGTLSADTPVDGAGVAIDWTGTVPVTVGADLAWDDATATVSTTAGGVFLIAGQIQLGLD